MRRLFEPISISVNAFTPVTSNAKLFSVHFSDFSEKIIDGGRGINSKLISAYFHAVKPT